MKPSIKKDLVTVRGALLDLTGMLNRPEPDMALLGHAGVDLDRALFPILARVARYAPLGIGELADLCGRDYTTVSRQVTKLEALELVKRQVNLRDARIKEVVLSKKGQTMTNAIDRSREELMTDMLADWDKQDLSELARLLRKLADDALDFTRQHKSG